MEKFTLTDKVEAASSYNTQPNDLVSIQGFYHAVCYDKDGNIKWEDDIENLVTTVGKNLTLDTILGNSAAGAIVMGLKGAGTPSAADTQAAHGTWNEVGATNAPTYTAPRKTPTFSAASGGSKTTSAASSFSITSTGAVAGCFINIGGSSTIDSTTGTLFSAGDFSSSKSVVNGDTIAVTYTCTLT